MKKKERVKAIITYKGKDYLLDNIFVDYCIDDGVRVVGNTINEETYQALPTKHITNIKFKGA